MNTTPAKDLKVGDTFSRTGSTRTYTVTEVIEAHRAEYETVLRVRSTTGTVATIAFPTGTTVVTTK